MVPILRNSKKIGGRSSIELDGFGSVSADSKQDFSAVLAPTTTILGSLESGEIALEYSIYFFLKINLFHREIYTRIIFESFTKTKQGSRPSLEKFVLQIFEFCKVPATT